MSKSFREFFVILVFVAVIGVVGQSVCYWAKGERLEPYLRQVESKDHPGHFVEVPDHRERSDAVLRHGTLEGIENAGAAVIWFCVVGCLLLVAREVVLYADGH